MIVIVNSSNEALVMKSRRETKSKVMSLIKWLHSTGNVMMSRYILFAMKFDVATVKSKRMRFGYAA